MARAHRTGQGGTPAPLPTGPDKTATVRAMFDAIAPRYDLVNRVMTFGLDQRWRRAAVAALALPEGARVLDLACGTGDLARLAARRRYRVLGTDLSAGMLAANRTGLPAVQGGAEALPFADGALDGIVCGYALRNFTDLAPALGEMARVLRPGGRLALLEVASPPPGPMRAGFALWFEHVVPLLGAALSDRDAYRYLPRSTAYLPEEARLRTLLVDAGFSGVGRRLLSGGLSQLLVGTRAGRPHPAEPPGPAPSRRGQAGAGAGALRAAAGGSPRPKEAEGLPDPAGFRALSVPVDPRLVAAVTDADPERRRGVRFLSPTLSVGGVGTAAVLALPGGLEDRGRLDDVVAWLACVPHDDRAGAPGAAVAAHGALPFERGSAAELVVPALRLVQDADGHAWATAVRPANEPLDPDGLRALVEQAATPLPSPAEGSPGRRPSGIARATAVEHRPPPAGYVAAVSQAVASIESGHLQKVVLARSLRVELDRWAPAGVDRPAPVAAILERLRAQEPSCTIFAHPIPGGWFVGASPELLVRRRGRSVTCHPLAGTVGLSGSAIDDQAIDAFMESKKDLAEHELMVDEIAAALARHCRSLSVPPVPSLVRLRSVAHFGTLIEGVLHAGTPAHVLELLWDLHPTPAVGGVPREPALELIARLEPGPREHWAGPVGWVDRNGDGEWLVGIRSATVSGRRAVLWAGSGIVARSDPEAELAETTVKLRPVLEAIVPGASASWTTELWRPGAGA